MRGDSGIHQGQFGLGRKHHFSLRFFRNGCLFVPASGRAVEAGRQRRDVEICCVEAVGSGARWRVACGVDLMEHQN